MCLFRYTDVAWIHFCELVLIQMQAAYGTCINIYQYVRLYGFAMAGRQTEWVDKSDLLSATKLNDNIEFRQKSNLLVLQKKVKMAYTSTNCGNCIPAHYSSNLSSTVCYWKTKKHILFVFSFLVQSKRSRDNTLRLVNKSLNGHTES